MDTFEVKMLTDNGYDTDAKRAFRVRALHAIHACRDNSRQDAVWDRQDGYGEPGYTPPQGWDWSGIRDSSYPAMVAMAAVVGVFRPAELDAAKQHYRTQARRLLTDNARVALHRGTWTTIEGFPTLQGRDGWSLRFMLSATGFVFCQAITVPGGAR